MMTLLQSARGALCFRFSRSTVVDALNCIQYTSGRMYIYIYIYMCAFIHRILNNTYDTCSLPYRRLLWHVGSRWNARSTVSPMYIVFPVLQRGTYSRLRWTMIVVWLALSARYGVARKDISKDICCRLFLNALRDMEI